MGSTVELVGLWCLGVVVETLRGDGMIGTRRIAFAEGIVRDCVVW